MNQNMLIGFEPVIKNYFFIYLMIIFNALTYSNFFYLWFLMELSNLFFYFIMNKLNYNNEMNLSYFIIQELSSISLFFFYLFQWDFMFNLMLLFKLSMFPFHNWLIKLNMKNNWMIIFFLLSFQKLIPLMMFNYFFSQDMFYLIIFNSIYSIILFLNVKNNKNMITISSMGNMSWVTLSIYNKNMMMLYFLIYMSLLFMLIYDMKINNFMNMNFKFSMSAYLMYVMMNYMSFPPTLMFILKMKIIHYAAMSNINLFMMIFLMMSSLFMSLIYFIFLINNFINSKILKLNYNFSKFFFLIYINLLLIFL